MSELVVDPKDNFTVEYSNRLWKTGAKRGMEIILISYLLLTGEIYSPRHNGYCTTTAKYLCNEYGFNPHELTLALNKLHKWGYIKLINKNDDTGEFTIYIEQDKPVKVYGKLRTKKDRKKYLVNWW